MAHERKVLTDRNRDDVVQTLLECWEYFDNRADADCDSDGYIPNKEMQLLVSVNEALAALGEDGK